MNKYNHFAYFGCMIVLFIFSLCNKLDASLFIENEFLQTDWVFLQISSAFFVRW